ncbi:MAG: glycosyltransferase family 2 protein [Chitinophagaceae bacterium]|jgi:glycosyltransferase involved in cell wall biosynthesis
MLSAVIITYNEEQNIGRCLQSLVGVADEVIVVDSTSTDKTCSIAEQYGATIIQHPFVGFAAQKNFAAQVASHNWVLSLDADEVLSEELKAGISAVKNKPDFDAYFIKRKTNFCGTFIRYGSWYPDKQCRLWDKTKGDWQGTIHEKWRLFGEAGKYGTLSGDLLHYSFNSISDYLKMTDRYTTLSAEEALMKGKNVSLLKLIFGPKFKFIQDYFIRLGFLDGYAGFVAYILASYMAFVKYSKIRAAFKNKQSK